MYVYICIYMYIYQNICICRLLLGYMYIHQKLCQLLANAHAAHQGHGASRGCRGRGQARTCWRPRSEMLQNCSDTLSSFLLPTMSFSTKLFRVPHTRTRAHGIKSQHKPTSQHKATSQRAAPSRDPSRRRMPHRACNPALHSDTISMRRAPSPTTSPTDPVRTPPPLDVCWRVTGTAQQSRTPRDSHARRCLSRAGLSRRARDGHAPCGTVTVTRVREALLLSIAHACAVLC